MAQLVKHHRWWADRPRSESRRSFNSRSFSINDLYSLSNANAWITILLQIILIQVHPFHKLPSRSYWTLLFVPVHSRVSFKLFPQTTKCLATLQHPEFLLLKWMGQAQLLKNKLTPVHSLHQTLHLAQCIRQVLLATAKRVFRSRHQCLCDPKRTKNSWAQTCFIFLSKCFILTGQGKATRPQWCLSYSLVKWWPNERNWNWKMETWCDLDIGAFVRTVINRLLRSNWSTTRIRKVKQEPSRSLSLLNTTIWKKKVTQVEEKKVFWKDCAAY